MTSVYTPVYTLGMTKKQYNFRLDPDLVQWVDDNAAENEMTRTAVVEELLYAAREGRLLIRPAGPDPFPAESTPAGTPSNPILVAGLE